MQARRDPVTAGLHVGAELRHVGLAGLTRGLELLVGLVDARLALGRDLLSVLLEAGAHVRPTLGVGTEAGDVGRARALRRRCGGRLLRERGTAGEGGEKDEGWRERRLDGASR